MGMYGDNRGFFRLGPGIYELLLGESYWYEYRSTRDEVLSLVHEPCTKLMRELAGTWGGCIVPQYKGEDMRPMMARILNRSGHSALPHDDFQKRYAAQFPWATNLTGQLGMNIYLELPEKGGQLQLWDISLSDSEYNSMRLNDSYGIERALLPEPSMTIKPSEGELVLIDTKKLHAISPLQKGRRITLSSFLGVIDEVEPLLMWS